MTEGAAPPDASAAAAAASRAAGPGPALRGEMPVPESRSAWLLRLHALRGTGPGRWGVPRTRRGPAAHGHGPRAGASVASTAAETQGQLSVASVPAADASPGWMGRSMAAARQQRCVLPVGGRRRARGPMDHAEHCGPGGVCRAAQQCGVNAACAAAWVTRPGTPGSASPLP